MDHQRILIVDDNEAIHKDIKANLFSSCKKHDPETLALEKELFSADPSASELSTSITFAIDDAYQGEEAVEMVKSAQAGNKPYSLVFMDVRMPPGMDGIQATRAIWTSEPAPEIVICTAYSDYSWDEIIMELGMTDRLLFLRKPFDPTGIKQLALSLTTKWKLRQETLFYINNLETEVEKRTGALNRTVADLMAANGDAARTIERLQRDLKQVSA